MHWQSTLITVEGCGQQVPKTLSLADLKVAMAFTAHSLCQKSEKNLQHDHLPAELSLEAVNFKEPKRSPQWARDAEKHVKCKLKRQQNGTQTPIQIPEMWASPQK